MDTYRAVVYACDENFRLFLLTYDSVQEFDGNFHEPIMNFTGDGIGVFGSCIADTVYFKVTQVTSPCEMPLRAIGGANR